MTRGARSMKTSAHTASEPAVAVLADTLQAIDATAATATFVVACVHCSPRQVLSLLQELGPQFRCVASAPAVQGPAEELARAPTEAVALSSARRTIDALGVTL